MTWRYDVYMCTNPEAEKHDQDCEMERVAEHYDHGYKDAFAQAHRTAEDRGHAAVWTVAPNGNANLSFQHIRGGGPCEACWPYRVRRGPWTKHVLGPRFICEPCAAQARRDLGKNFGWSADECPWYWPVLGRSSRVERVDR
ncbi:hypothetical protein ACH5AU_30710 [Streptomyces albidoflavus]